MPPTLLVALDEDDLPPPGLARIGEAAGDVYRVVRTNGKAEVHAHLDDAEIALGWFPPSLLPEAVALRWIQSWAAGTNWLFEHEEIEARPDLVVTTASGVHPAPIAEHVVGMLVMLARRFPPMLGAQRERRWTKDRYQYHDMMELAGSRLTVVGTGAIGQRVARAASGLGMTPIVGVRRDPSKSVPHVDTMLGTGQLHDALAEADAVVVTLPKTPQTESLFDELVFAAMKPGVFFVNVGRGEVVDEAALVEALRSGAVGGAGLDVFAEEPLPTGSPLWTMENVIVTPHVAGLTPRYAERATTLFIENLARWRRGEPLENVAQHERGY